MARMTKRTRVQNRAKRGTYITPRAAVTPILQRDYWPALHTPKPYRRYVVHGYVSPKRTRYPLPINHAPRARLERIPSRLRPMIQLVGKQPRSGMHDTPFKRPTIAPYGAWARGIGYLVPHTVKVCVQRKQRREAIFASTGGGRIRRKPNNQRTPQSEIRCR